MYLTYLFSIDQLIFVLVVIFKIFAIGLDQTRPPDGQLD